MPPTSRPMSLQRSQARTASRQSVGRGPIRVLLPFLAAALAAGGCGRPMEAPAGPLPEIAPGVAYTHHVLPDIPESIHVARIPRAGGATALRSLHAGDAAFGLSTISEQVRSIPAGAAEVLAAVNGDFYQRERTYAGDPRGLQVLGGDVVSAPKGVCLWTDDAGEPHVGEVRSAFAVTWPDGTRTPLAVNEDPAPDRLVLFTPRAGTTTRTSGTREWTLRPDAGSVAVPLRLSTRVKTTVEASRDGGDAPIPRDGWVLSAGPALAKRLPQVRTGAEIAVDLATEPALATATEAIGGGPVLVRDGRPLPIEVPDDDAYQFKSMRERHPRSAVGWNREHWFLVGVDGRQDGAAGMTLEELAAYLAALGCTDAMNLDGGGSATLWAAGSVRNRPSDGRERPIANALAVVRLRPAGAPGSAAGMAPPRP